MAVSGNMRKGFFDGHCQIHQRGAGQEVLAASVNGEVWDLSRPIQQDATVKLLTWEDTDGKTTFWHSSAHLMAEAVQSMFPAAKFWVGPAVDKGFYYDIDLGDQKISDDDLAGLEKKCLNWPGRITSTPGNTCPSREAVEYFTTKGMNINSTCCRNLRMARSRSILKVTSPICAVGRISQIRDLSRRSN